MLTIKDANKCFNKRKRNKIQAIDHSSISFESKGFIALLGPSGCGKTTLLNAIGGLDKLDSGSIYIDGRKISGRFSSRVDKIRNLMVGYIFQDYKLVDNLSVYDNVAMVLKMIGIKDKGEIDNRVCYVLDKVGMLRYKRRPCGMLSGGERQRVGIARAIVKDPNIILADEPTGNLDSKNSLEIMKIIRSISRDRLVILVTHEQDLARFYADRIVEISDGKIVNDYENDCVSKLDYRLDNTFYLKDFKYGRRFGDKDVDINIYSNDINRVGLDIVVMDGNIYIKSNTLDKVEVVLDDSSIEFVNEHYKVIEKSEIDKYSFDFKNVVNNDFKRKYCSILGMVSLIKNGFKKVFDYSILKKILLLGFGLAGMFLMYAVSTIWASLTIDDSLFVKVNKNYLNVMKKDVKVLDYLDYENNSDIIYMMPGDSLVSFGVKYLDYYQTSGESDTLRGSLSSWEMIDEDDLIYGYMPSNDNEVVVDKMTILNMFKSEVAKMAGVLEVRDMVGRFLNVKNMNDFKIVGIVDRGSPSIYANRDMFVNIIANSLGNGDIEIVDYELYKDKIELRKGSYPVNDYEVIVNIDNMEQMPLNKEISNKINDKKLKVVGYYYSKNNYDLCLVNNNTIKYNNIINNKNITIYANDKERVKDYFFEKEINIIDSYAKDREEYIESREEYTNSSLVVSSIILVISLIEIFLMIRSSFLSRIKEIGIYRAIGVKKIDIYKMFFGEIFATLTLASVPGILLMAYILNILSGISYISSYFVVNIYVVFVTVGVVYLFNLLVGLIPVFNTIRKTPAQILSRYDLD